MLYEVYLVLISLSYPPAKATELCNYQWYRQIIKPISLIACEEQQEREVNSECSKRNPVILQPEWGRERQEGASLALTGTEISPGPEEGQQRHDGFQYGAGCDDRCLWWRRNKSPRCCFEIGCVARGADFPGGHLNATPEDCQRHGSAFLGWLLNARHDTL